MDTWRKFDYWSVEDMKRYERSRFYRARRRVYAWVMNARESYALRLAPWLEGGTARTERLVNKARQSMLDRIEAERVRDEAPMPSDVGLARSRFEQAEATFQCHLRSRGPDDKWAVQWQRWRDDAKRELDRLSVGGSV